VLITHCVNNTLAHWRHMAVHCRQSRWTLWNCIVVLDFSFDYNLWTSGATYKSRTLWKKSFHTGSNDIMFVMRFSQPWMMLFLYDEKRCFIQPLMMSFVNSWLCSALILLIFEPRKQLLLPLMLKYYYTSNKLNPTAKQASCKSMWNMVNREWNCVKRHVMPQTSAPIFSSFFKVYKLDWPINQFYFARCGKTRDSTKDCEGWGNDHEVNMSANPYKEQRERQSEVCRKEIKEKKHTKEKNSRYITDQVQKKTSQTSSGMSNELTRDKDGFACLEWSKCIHMPGINLIYIWKRSCLHKL